MSETVHDWVVSHQSDYARTVDRLEAVRNVVLHGRLDAACDIVRRSYMFAVLSIQTERDRHERAFTAHYAGDLSRSEAALETVYGGQKGGWIEATFDRVNWENVVLAMRSHIRHARHATLLEAITDTLTGVAYRKGAFMLAMCGLYEFACVDSNVARYAGVETDGRLRFTDADDYLSTCDSIMRDAGLSHLPPFVSQWAIYDYERGEHARHMTYFREVLPPLQ